MRDQWMNDCLAMYIERDVDRIMKISCNDLKYKPL